MNSPELMTRRRLRLRAIYVVALLSLIGFFNTADGVVLSVVLPKIKPEFQLSYSQVGLLSAAFTVALALGAIPIGIWADRSSRRLVIGLGVGVWSLFTLLTGFAQNFFQLFAFRSVVGVGEASYLPAGMALLADHFGKQSRGRAVAAVATMAGLGIGGGLIIGGVVGQHFGWRAAFFLAGIPGLGLALLALTMHEPPRGEAESAGPKVVASPETGLRSLLGLLRIRTFAAAVAAAALAQFGFAVISFLPLYLSQKFGLSLSQVGALVGAPQLLAAVVMGPLAGVLIDWRARRTPRAAVEVGIGGLLLAAAGMLVMFSASSVAVYAAGEILFVFTAGVTVLATPVILQNVIAPSLRASAGSINLTISRLVGSALSPIAIGVVSDLPHSNLGLSMLLLGPVAFALAACCLAMSSMERDVEAMEASWSARQPLLSAETTVERAALAVGRA